MKKIITTIILSFTVLLGCLSFGFVGSASTDIANNIYSEKEEIEETLSNENSSVKLDDKLTNQVYEANGFSEADKRTEINLKTDISINSKKQVNSNSINAKTTKSYIYDRMLNSIDYFQTLQATYYFLPPTGDSYYSTYCIEQGDMPRSKELIYNENGELISCDMFDGENAVTVNGDAENVQANISKKTKQKLNKSDVITKDIVSERSLKSVKNIVKSCNNPYYKKLSVNIEEQEKLDFVSLVDSQKRIKYLKDEEDYCYYYRSNLPQLSISYEQYFSQAYAFGFLSDFKNWDIDRIDTCLGRECFVISGNIDGTYSEKMKTKSFEMWVDKEIGALLMLKGYDENNEISVQLTTYEFVVDEAIDQSSFEDLSNL